MKMKRTIYAARLRTIFSVMAALLVVFAGVAAASSAAWAAEPPAPGEYYQDPLEGVSNQPGFEWVDKSAEGNTRGTGYYRIYNALSNNPTSHEAASGWYYFAQASRDHTFDGYLVVLDSDIDFSGVDWGRVNNDTHAYTVGSEDQRFSGTFDGNGHTLSNFTNERDGLQLQMDNGFFGWVNDATIKNVNFKDCYVGSTYRGALVAGYAQDTFFLNILAEDCTTSIVPANNVLNLITNAGISGGTIAGVANGCTLYNCEMRAGRVVTNSTAGVAALGGQPLYMGGLVGQANDAIIEYCRVTDKWVEGDDGAKTRTYAEVKGTYETAVSVANYSEVFVGGIVGCMQNEDTGTKIIDCYSTADVYGKAAIYFGVGLGLGVSRAYPGGIAGIVRADGAGENLIQRVSYAGNLHSYQYNIALLGIPIIETDKYMGGIVSVGGGNVTLDQTYFERSASATENEIPVYQNWTTDTDGPADGDAYGPRDDSYTDRDFWEGCDFDFAGGTLRNVGYTFTPDVTEDEWNENHYNKWVMDYTRGIPVHGGSIKATMDFPGSGTVTIGTTSLATDEKSKQSTTNPYDFAVQGYLAGDPSIDLTYAFTTDENDSWAADEQNQGFRFIGWYGSRGVQVNDIAEDHSLFTTPNSTLKTDGEGLLSERYRVAEDTDSDGQPDVLTVKYPSAPDNPQTGEYADNDLYVAYAQAQVLLHDVDGGLVNTSGESDSDTTNDWYDYNATITLPKSVTAGTTPAGNLIGWTTVANTADGQDVGYASIDSATLASLKEQGAFWEPGALYTVTAPANLYPVYSQYENVSVIYEGHDVEGNLTTRSGYGTAVKGADSSTGDLTLSVQPADGSPLLGDDPTVRFLGWYQYVGDATTAEEADEDANPANWLRVSRGTQEDNLTAGDDCFTFNVSQTDADLTQNLIYKARFEYRVDYWACQGPESGDPWGEYARVWHRYGQEFDNIAGPSIDDDRQFLHWSQVFTEDNDPKGLWECTNSADVFSGTITEPERVYAHNDGNGFLYQHIYATVDFPGLGSAAADGDSNATLTYTPDASLQDEQLFIFWTFDRDSGSSISGTTYESSNNPWDTDRTISGSNEWWAEAHVQAKVTFHGVPNQEEPTYVYRVYQQKVFLNETVINTYTWHYADEHSGSNPTTTSESAASPTDKSMARQGYIFLGWLDMSDTEVEAVQSRIVDQMGDETDAYLAKTPELVAPYLMTGDEICTRPMDLYPVYARFDVNTTTNIAEAGVDTSVYNIPADPSIADAPIASAEGKVLVTFNDDASATVTELAATEVSYNASNNGAVTVTVDSDQTVWKDQAQGSDVYTFSSLSVYEDDVLVQTIPASEFAKGEGTLTSNAAIVIAAGHSYEFIANYSPVPVLVTYHMSESGDGSTQVFSTEVGNVLPTPTGTPSFSGYEDAFVVGWIEGDAEGTPTDYADDLTILTPGKDLVTGTMHLWPVYLSGNVTVQSNIDSDMGGDIGFRRVVKHAGDESGLWLEADEVAGYEFKGWSKDYESNDSYNMFTTQNQYRLTGEDRFDGTTYTAIYERVNQIRYHDTEGNVIYTASVGTDDERTFVTEQQVDVTQPDGTTSTETQAVPIDTQAFTQIAASIAQKNAAEDATTYEQFVMWQWADTDTDAPERWSTDEGSFVNEPVNDNMGDDGVMDLYPVTVTLAATDSNDAAYTGIEAQLELDDTTNTLSKATVTLQESYNQPWMKIHIEEVAYAPGTDGTVKGTTTPQTDIPVELYTPGSQMGSPVATDTTRSKNEGVNLPNGGTVDLVAGDALFTFSGRITITKTVTDPRAAGQTFSFTVSNGTDTRAVSIQMPEEPENGTYTGTATINVPFGSYTVTEDAGWAWRYSAELEHWELDADTAVDGNQSDWVSGGEVTVEFDSAVSTYNRDGVTSAVRANNKLTNDDWFSDEATKHNVFTEGAGE